jgi:hypothetical protein
MLSTLAYWEGLILLGGFFGTVLWKLLTGGISLEQLLEGDVRHPNASEGDSTSASPGRAQSLVSTIFVSAYYLLQVVQNPKEFPKLPPYLIAVLAGSQALYLAGKAQAMLLGPLLDFLKRRTP